MKTTVLDVKEKPKKEGARRPTQGRRKALGISFSFYHF